MKKFISVFLALLMVIVPIAQMGVFAAPQVAEVVDTVEEKVEIVTVTVQVDAAAQLGTRSLSLSNVMISSDSGDKVSNVKYEYASIEITDQIPGDINGDGTFDYYDVSKLFAVFRGKSTIESSVDTDINGDGIFDYYDVSKLFAIHRGKATFN